MFRKRFIALVMALTMLFTLMAPAFTFAVGDGEDDSTGTNVTKTAGNNDVTDDDDDPIVGGDTDPIEGGENDPVVGGDNDPVVGGENDPTKGGENDADKGDADKGGDQGNGDANVGAGDQGNGDANVGDGETLSPATDPNDGEGDGDGDGDDGETPTTRSTLTEGWYLIGTMNAGNDGDPSSWTVNDLTENDRFPDPVNGVSTLIRNLVEDDRFKAIYVHVDGGVPYLDNASWFPGEDVKPGPAGRYYIYFHDDYDNPSNKWLRATPLQDGHYYYIGSDIDWEEPRAVELGSDFSITLTFNDAAEFQIIKCHDYGLLDWYGDSSGQNVSVQAGTYIIRLEGSVATATQVYTLTTAVSPADSGTLVASKNAAAEGDQITLTVTPAAGYRYDKLVVNGVDNTDPLDANNQIVIIMTGADATVTAYFAAIKYVIETDANIAHGSVFASPNEATIGQEVTLTVTPEEGYQVSEVKVNGVAIEPVNGDYSFTMPAANVTVTATFTVDPATAVAKIGDEYFTTLQAALTAAREAAAGGWNTTSVTVEIIQDITFSDGDTWTPVVFNQLNPITIKGNGHTITNLPGMLYAKSGSGVNKLIMNDLTFDRCNVSTSDTSGGFALIMGYMDSGYGAEFNNVTIKNSAISGGKWTGAFVGYAAGYSNVNDGPVYQHIIFNNCKVENTSISANGSVGALMGHAGGNKDGRVVVSGTIVTGNTITCEETGSHDKAGALVGTIGALGPVNKQDAGLFIAATVSGNTVTSDGTTITTIYGRQGSTTGALTLNPGGSYDNYPIEQDKPYAQCVEGYILKANDQGAYSVVPIPKVAKIGDVGYTSLQAALDAAHEMTGNVTVTLLADIEGYSIVHQKAGLNLTIDGANHTLEGQIIIDGDGRASGTETLTIRNVKFEDDNSHFCSGTDTFILVPSTKTSGAPYYTNLNNYAHNITVENCSFTGEYGNTVIFRSSSGGGGAYNVTLNNLTGTNLHSLAQFTGTTGATITNCTVTESESFLNVSGGTGAYIVEGNTFTCKEGAIGYAVRENGTSTAVITLRNNTFTAASAVVLGKGTSVTQGTITVESGNYKGDLTKTDAATGKINITGGYFTVPPKYDFCGTVNGEHLYAIENTNEATKADYPYTVGTGAVAMVNEVGYFSFANAAAARTSNDDVIKLLENITDEYTLTAGEPNEILKVQHDGKALTVKAPEGYARKDKSETVEGVTVTTYTLAAIYTVTFNANGGSEVEAQQVEDGQTATQPTDPTKEHYSFQGWFAEGATEAFNFTTPITANVTLYAKWLGDPCTITFINGYTGETLHTVSARYGDPMPKFVPDPLPTREGYDLDENNLWTPVPGETVTGSIFYSLNWIEQHTVTFDANGGTLKDENNQEVASITKKVSHNGTVEAPTPTREGHTFLGWFDGNNEFDFTKPVHDSFTLLAHWQINQYTVTFMDGDTMVQTTTADYGTPITAPTVPEREGWIFKGWDVDEVPTTIPAQNMVINTVWAEAVARIDDTLYETLAGAVAAVQSGETIVVLKDLDCTGLTITLPTGVTGVTIKGEDPDDYITLTDLTGMAKTNSYLTFENILFERKSVTLTMRGSNITFDHCDFTSTYGGVVVSTLKDANDFTFSYCNFSGKRFDGGTLIGNNPSVTNLTIDHCTFTMCNNGIYSGYLSGEVRITNSVFHVKTYVHHTGSGKPKGTTSYYCENNEYWGWNSFGAEVYPATFKDCVFHYQEEGYNMVRPYQDTTYEGCTIEKGVTLDVLSGLTDTYTECYIKDGDQTVLLTALNYADVVNLRDTADAIVPVAIVNGTIYYSSVRTPDMTDAVNAAYALNDFADSYTFYCDPNPVLSTLEAYAGKYAAYQDETTKTWIVYKLVTSITLAPTELVFVVGDTATQTLTATIVPDEALNKEIVWTSSDETVATVDENGVVTPVGQGTATITAAMKAQSDIKAEATVVVAVAKIEKDGETTYYPTLQAAVTAAYGKTGNVTITVLKDLTENVTIQQQRGLNLTVDGGNHTIKGQFLLDGGGFYGDDTLTIKSFNFKYEGATMTSGTDAFVYVLTSGTLGRLSDTHNVTVKDSTFDGDGSNQTFVAVKATSGTQNKNFILENLTAKNVHSLAQLTAVNGITITGCNATEGVHNGINISGGAGSATISGNTIVAEGYSIRLKGGSSMAVTLTDNTFSGSEGIVSEATGGGTITVVDGKYAGPLPTDGAKFTVKGGVFSVAPTLGVCEEGKYPILNTDPETKAEYPYTVGDAVAMVKNIGYPSVANAAAARNGDVNEVITLLKSADYAFVAGDVLKIYKANDQIVFTYTTVQDDYVVTLSEPVDGVVTYTAVGAVAKIEREDKTLYFATIQEAVTAANENEVIEVIAAGDYTLPGLSKKVTLKGAVDGVVFNHTTAGNIAAIPNGATIKNVTFNLGNNNYHGFQHNGGLTFEGCTFNGKFFTYGNETYNNCTFTHTGDYNMWVYGGSTVVYDGCTFNNTGKFLHLYNESGASLIDVTINNCEFINSGSANKAAVNVKETCGAKLLQYNVKITNCKIEGAFPEGSESAALVVGEGGLWQVDDRLTNGAEPGKPARRRDRR